MVSGVKLQYVIPSSGNGKGKKHLDVSDDFQPESGSDDGYFQLHCTEAVDGNTDSGTVRIFTGAKGFPLTPYYIGRNSDEQIVACFAAQDVIEVTVNLQTKLHPNLRRKICIAEVTIIRHQTDHLEGGHQTEELMPPIRASVRLPGGFLSIEQLKLLMGALGQKIPRSCITFWGGLSSGFGKILAPDEVFYARLKDGQTDPRAPRTTSHQLVARAS